MTPEDYLEKIFNVPLVLPVMTPGSLRKLLQGLAAESVERDSPRPDRALTVPSTGPSVRPSPVGTVPVGGDTVDGILSAAPIPVEAGSEIAESHAEHPEEPGRPLTERELELLEALESLIQTPREAKRLMNLYGMLRSTRDLSEASRFLGDDRNPGEFEAVIVLLGLLTAHARLLGQVLDAVPSREHVVGGLMHQPADSHWIDFVGRMEPRQDAGRWSNGVVGEIAPADLADWRRLHAGILPASQMVKLPNLEAFHLWAPRIRCFSFVLSPLAAAVTHAPQPRTAPPEPAPKWSPP